MKLKKLLQDIPHLQIKGPKEISITGLSANSKLVAPGNLFIAKKGLTSDGAKFIPEALAAGALGVVTDMYNPFYPEVTQVIHPDVSFLEAELVWRYYDFPATKLYLIGITGTNGKTTSSYLIKHLFDHLEKPCGLIGTIESIIGAHVYPSTMTTADLITNGKLLHEMVLHGCGEAVMEVTSHALTQDRVRGLTFDVALFTNLTQDHLDYHKTMENYAAAKARLFTLSRHCVVNRDSPWWQTLCPNPSLTYGLNSQADLYADEISLTPSGTRCTVHYNGHRVPFSTPLIGRYNIYNCLGAIGVGLIRGHTLATLCPLFATFPKVVGRLEPVPNPRGLKVFVDYAHTDDALKNVLETLQELPHRKIITLFGCGGNRDPHKRPKMGAVAERLSDQVILTTDNPRNEDPATIIRDILRGMSDPSKLRIIPDRATAIQTALSLTTPDDILLIAGKGHETYQILGSQTIPFDDREKVEQAFDANR